MLLKHDQQRVKDLLSETITLLCKNSLFFKTEFTVEALIGITLDKSEVLLMNINETITLPGDQKVNRVRQESVDKELNLDSVSLKKSAHNDDVDSSHKTKQSRKSESVSSASKSLPSRYRSIAPSFTDSNARRESPVLTHYDNIATPTESNTLYMPYSSGHKSSSFLASKKKRRIDLSGNSISSPVAESSSGLADVAHEIKNSSQIRSLITLAHEKNDDEIIDLDLDVVKQEPHERNYNSSDLMEDEQESRTDNFMIGRSSSNNRRRSFSRNISDEMNQSQSDHKQDQIQRRNSIERSIISDIRMVDVMFDSQRNDYYISNGKSFESLKTCRGRSVKPQDCSLCQLQCTVNISEEQRQQIFTDYWEEKMDARDFMQQFVIQVPIKHVKRPMHHSRRSRTFNYFLPLGDRVVKVCKMMFLNTLGLGEKQMYMMISKLDSCWRQDDQ